MLRWLDPSSQLWGAMCPWSGGGVQAWRGDRGPPAEGRHPTNAQEGGGRPMWDGLAAPVVGAAGSSGHGARDCSCPLHPRASVPRSPGGEGSLFQVQRVGKGSHGWQQALEWTGRPTSRSPRRRCLPCRAGGTPARAGTPAPCWGWWPQPGCLWAAPRLLILTSFHPVSTAKSQGCACACVCVCAHVCMCVPTCRGGLTSVPAPCPTALLGSYEVQGALSLPFLVTRSLHLL